MIRFIFACFFACFEVSKEKSKAPLQSISLTQSPATKKAILLQMQTQLHLKNYPAFSFRLTLMDPVTECARGDVTIVHKTEEKEIITPQNEANKI